MAKSYALYHTLNKNLKKGDVPAKQLAGLVQSLNKLMDEDKKKAVLMLVIEHRRVVEEQTIDPSDFTLPYEGVQTSSGVSFDVKNLPSELQWILLKFTTAFGGAPKVNRAKEK